LTDPVPVTVVDGAEHVTAVVPATLQVKVTVPVNPFVGVTVRVEGAVLPASTVMLALLVTVNPGVVTAAAHAFTTFATFSDPSPVAML